MHLTRTSFQAPAAGHRASAHASTAPRIRHRVPVSLFSVALTLGMLISPTSPQASGVLAGDQPVTDSGDRRTITHDRVLGIGPDVTGTSVSGQRRVQPWRAWPGISGESARDGSMTDGLPPSGLDGGMCWPHGDHFHCR
jgi:hypothetical protein